MGHGNRVCACPVCGKFFWYSRAVGWGYWYGRDAVCSYGCMRTMRRTDMMDEEIRARVRDLHSRGMSPREIADELGIRAQAVGSVLRTGRKNRVTSPVPPEPAGEAVEQAARIGTEIEALEGSLHAAEAGNPDAETVLRLLREWTEILKKLIGGTNEA